MELEIPNNGERQASESACNGEALGPLHPTSLPDDVDSACSTPYVSAPSSPGRGGCFFSAPASPMHFVLSSSPYTYAGAAAGAPNAAPDASVAGPFEFEFSARCSGVGGGAAGAGSMISADELFLNGQIRPVRLSSHLQRPQILAPLLDLGAEEEDEEAAIRGRDPRLRSRPLKRRTRSMSPLRNAPFKWRDDEEKEQERINWPAVASGGKDGDPEVDPDLKQVDATTPSVSASSSRSSSTSSSRSSKRWVFLKDFLYRSKSEGRGNAKDKFWHAIAFSPSKEKSSYLFFRDRSKDSTNAASSVPHSPTSSESQKQRNMRPSVASPATADGTKMASSASSKPASRWGRRRVPAPSPHERHYTTNRAQAEEMRKKTFLPYRQGLLGCLWFSSRSYGAMNGLARTLNPVSSG